ncbi:hypothetical protein N9917_02345 [Deltaproteobacteria bacterium]|nr:hypothetical protein [Deltaproteobacteria bacterium]
MPIQPIQPFNYQIAAQDPAKSMMNALKFGQLQQQMQQSQAQSGQQQEMNQQAIQQNAIKLQAERRKQREEAVWLEKSNAYHANPDRTNNDLQELITYIPGQRKALALQSYNNLKAAEKTQRKGLAVQMFAGLMQGTPEGNMQVQKQAKETADVFRASGKPENIALADGLDGVAELAVTNPDQAKALMVTGLVGMGGEKELKAVFDMRKSEQDAALAPLNASLKKEQIQAEKAKARLSTMKRIEAKTTNPQKRKELKLKIEKTEFDLEEKKKDRIAKGKTGIAQAKSLQETADKILASPVLDEVVGAFNGSAAADFVRTEDAELDVIALIDTLSSKVTMDNLDKMSGVLTDRDLVVLAQAAGNLTRRQSAKQFKATVNDIVRLTKKAKLLREEQYDLQPSQRYEDEGASPGEGGLSYSSGVVDSLLDEFGSR